MKVIDLLNKIANGEEPPKQIFYKKQWWEYNPYNDYEGTEWGGCLLNNVCINELNSEITAYIEEEKEIEKIDIDKNDISWCEGNMKTDEDMVDIFLKTKDKINEIIRELNELKKGK